MVILLLSKAETSQTTGSERSLGSLFLLLTLSVAIQLLCFSCVRRVVSNKDGGWHDVFVRVSKYNGARGVGRVMRESADSGGSDLLKMLSNI